MPSHGYLNHLTLEEQLTAIQCQAISNPLDLIKRRLSSLKFFKEILIPSPIDIHVFTWWRHQMEIFSTLLAICAGNSPVTGEFPAQGQWRGALMFSLICARINGWVNNGKAGDLRRHRAHYDVTVMKTKRMMMTPWHGNPFRITSPSLMMGIHRLSVDFPPPNSETLIRTNKVDAMLKKTH